MLPNMHMLTHQDPGIRVIVSSKMYAMQKVPSVLHNAFLPVRPQFLAVTSPCPTELAGAFCAPRGLQEVMSGLNSFHQLLLKLFACLLVFLPLNFWHLWSLCFSPACKLSCLSDFSQHISYHLLIQPHHWFRGCMDNVEWSILNEKNCKYLHARRNVFT